MAHFIVCFLIHNFSNIYPLECSLDIAYTLQCTLIFNIQVCKCIFFLSCYKNFCVYGCEFVNFDFKFGYLHF